jgi:hypothetical protein
MAPHGACLTRRGLLTAAVGTAAAGGLTRHPLAQPAEDWSAVVAGARREGRVVFYCNLQPNGIEPLLQLFREANSGIRTEYIRLGSAPLIERFQTEFNAGRHQAAVPDDALARLMQREGRTFPHDRGVEVRQLRRRPARGPAVPQTVVEALVWEGDEHVGQVPASVELGLEALDQRGAAEADVLRAYA